MTRPDGSNVCYWSQNGVIPTLALTCHTGSCVYEMVGSSDGACPVHFDPPQYWTGDAITRAAMFVIVLLLVTAAWAYIRVEADTRYFEDEGGVNDDDDEDVVGGAVEAVRRFESTMQPKDGPSSVLTWTDINVEVKSCRTRILTSVSGMAGRVEDAHGGMCALMGPSGAGKTTLLDRLAGRLSPKVYDSSGDVFINGKLASIAELQTVSGYVTAEDVLPGTATVYEHLLFHAKLRLPSRTRASTLQKRDADGDFWILGRVDDVLNVAGHRIGTMEVESALVEHPAVAEAAVVGKSHEIKGQAICAFVTLRDGHAESLSLRDDLRAFVVQKIGALARPDELHFTADLPKTRSGKIMRRLLRDTAEGRLLGDVTTLADPTVMESLKARYADQEG